MTWVIVAGALGVIIITGGLFLRRLLGELATLRGQLTEHGRQITGIDRQMRAQRAHVNILRQLLAGDGDHNGDIGQPLQAAVVNGNGAAPGAASHPDGPEPVRRRGHLGLHIGGAAAALATLSGAAREAARSHGTQLVSAVAGAVVTAATVTVITVQPWTHDTSYEPPHADPPASSPPTYAPPGPRPSKPPGSPPSSSSAPSTASPTGPSVSPSPSATGPTPTGPSVSPSPSATGPTPSGRGSQPPAVPVVPAEDQAPAGGASPAGPGSGAEDDTSGEADEPPPADDPSPGLSPEPTQPPPDPEDDPPPAAEEPADSGLCVDLSVPPLADSDVCVLR